MKYVMFEKSMSQGVKLALPFIFPNHLVHADVAEAMLAGPLKDAGWRVVSAGEYTPMNGSCTGKSDTLKKRARRKDGQIILMHDYGAGFQ